MAIDTKLRYNPDAGEVELVVGEAVAMSSGKDVFESWAKHWADANGFVPKAEVAEPVKPAAPVEPKVEPTPDPVPPAEPVKEINPSEPVAPVESAAEPAAE